MLFSCTIFNVAVTVTVPEESSAIDVADELIITDGIGSSSSRYLSTPYAVAIPRAPSPSLTFNCCNLTSLENSEEATNIALL